MSIVRFASIAALACVAVSASSPSIAQGIYLDLNRGNIGVAPPPPPGPRFRDERGFGERRVSGVSCGEARRIVRQNGYRNVRVMDCTGRSYSFQAVDRGQLVRISVSAFNGRITGVEFL